MRRALENREVHKVIILVFGLLAVSAGYGESGCPKASGALWQAAWERAAAVESPLDAGRAQVALAQRAFQEACAERLEGWVDQALNEEVRASVLALASAAAAFAGRREEAEQRLKEARELLARLNEWQRAFAGRDVVRAEAAGILMAGADGRPHVDLLDAWVAAVPAERAAAAAWACAEWSVRHATGAAEEMTEAAVKAAFKFGGMLNFREQAVLLARMASVLSVGSLPETGRAAVTALLGKGDLAAQAENRFDILAQLARGAWGSGNQGLAEALLAEIVTRAKQGRTGDAKAPWAHLAETQAALGCEAGDVRATLLTGLERAGDRPGYHCAVAQALTLGALAAARYSWSAEDVRAALEKGGVAH